MNGSIDVAPSASPPTRVCCNAGIQFCRAWLTPVQRQQDLDSALRIWAPIRSKQGCKLEQRRASDAALLALLHLVSGPKCFLDNLNDIRRTTQMNSAIFNLKPFLAHLNRDKSGSPRKNRHGLKVDIRALWRGLDKCQSVQPSHGAAYGDQHHLRPPPRTRLHPYAALRVLGRHTFILLPEALQTRTACRTRVRTRACLIEPEDQGHIRYLRLRQCMYDGHSDLARLGNV